MAEPVDRPPRRLPWWAIGVVLVLAALGAIWVVKLLLGLVWLLIEVAVLAFIVVVVFTVLRSRSRSRGRRRQRQTPT